MVTSNAEGQGHGIACQGRVARLTIRAASARLSRDPDWVSFGSTVQTISA